MVPPITAVTWSLSVATCVAILVLSAANPCMGREGDHLGDESSLPMSRVVESALAISAETLQDSGTQLEGLPPSQSVAPAIVSADSKPIRSRGGNRWSPWYRLGIGKAPAGYVLQRVEFWITGDSKWVVGRMLKNYPGRLQSTLEVQNPQSIRGEIRKRRIFRGTPSCVLPSTKLTARSIAARLKHSHSGSPDIRFIHSVIK